MRRGLIYSPRSAALKGPPCVRGPERGRKHSNMQRFVHHSSAALRLVSGALVFTYLSAFSSAQAPQTPRPAAGAQQTPPPAGRGGAAGQAPRTMSPASQRPPETVTPQSYPPEQIAAGRTLFGAQCGFCHGRDAMGGETGPDLTRSALVAEDVRGDKIAPLVHTGRPDKGMPAFNQSDTDVAAIVAFIHDSKKHVDSLEGNRRTVDVADLQTGNAQAGQQYFNGPGGCTKCHSATGDLAGIAARYQGLQLLQRMLNPSSGRGRGAPAASPVKITVTLASGQTVTGTHAYRDEFTVGLRDAEGWYRSWPASSVRFTIDDPLDAHFDQLGKYTDKDMHDVLAYLETLR
jgi:cytochrome c oxidase cbb3-type subunit 3